MDQFNCTRCSKEVHPGRGDYFLVRIDAVADPQPPIIAQEDLDQDLRAEIERLICLMKNMSEQQLERQVYRHKAIYLCIRCFNHWIENPVSQ
jgi:DNA-directed RNA polymerase subunit RPC12/RpoP